MAMNTVLEKLEQGLDEILKRYLAAVKKVEGLEAELAKLRKTTDAKIEKLESRVESLKGDSKGRAAAERRASQLAERVAGLEKEAAGGSEAAERVADLEHQKAELTTRLQSVLERIDVVLTDAEGR